MVLPDWRETICKPMIGELMSILHRGSHWGLQAISGYSGIYTIAKQMCEGCVTFQRINKRW
jgi:hypothetical protein